MTDPNRDTGERHDETIHIDAEDARGAEIVLRKRRSRAIFIAGLVGIVVLALVLRFIAWG